MIQQFVDRDEELAFLSERFGSASAEFIILYGRRRVGKTEIIKQFIKNKKSIYFLADRRPEAENIRELQKNMAEFLKDSLFEKVKFENYVELFKEFAEKCRNQRIVLVIDEFSYLMEGNKAIDSIFQKIWDEHLRKTKVFLILCGSSISMMESLMGYKNPLYGRRTGQWNVELLKFGDARKFLPKYDIENQIKAFSVLDGIPQYLLQFDDKKELIENLKEKVFNRGSFLYIEPEFLLREELREPRNYFSILKSISFGNTTFGEITNHTQLDKTLVSKYIDTLITLHLIEKIYPVTLRKEKTRDTRYKINDNFFDFWFKFIYAHKEDIEENKAEAIEKIMGAEFNTYVGRKFEAICAEFLLAQHRKNLAPFKIEKIGNWWHKDNEIDIIALNESKKEILFCECKWHDKLDAKRILTKLKERVKFVDWERDVRKEHYAIFAKSFKEKFKEPNVLLFDINDMEKLF
ncbi:MAG: ATP-binding protein [Nanoarchaeota archaeon]|nr:ATP-binding protein [Nanoarchaeota archaeon]MBU4452037.1 ATP-binding protein [Nanoarchaeota archaeon]MCG2724391.1 ATP-binding protein [archaeon]